MAQDKKPKKKPKPKPTVVANGKRFPLTPTRVDRLKEGFETIKTRGKLAEARKTMNRRRGSR